MPPQRECLPTYQGGPSWTHGFNQVIHHNRSNRIFFCWVGISSRTAKTDSKNCGAGCAKTRFVRIWASACFLTFCDGRRWLAVSLMGWGLSRDCCAQTCFVVMRATAGFVLSGVENDVDRTAFRHFVLYVTAPSSRNGLDGWSCFICWFSVSVCFGGPSTFGC